jgi:hypothetical protein
MKNSSKHQTNHNKKQIVSNHKQTFRKNPQKNSKQTDKCSYFSSFGINRGISTDLSVQTFLSPLRTLVVDSLASSSRP